MYILTRGATHSKFWWGYIIEQKKRNHPHTKLFSYTAWQQNLQDVERTKGRERE